jgi:co-chaperonin GroES (HSP10)
MTHEHQTYTHHDGRTLTMMNDNILVKPDKHDRVSDGGIIFTHDQHPLNTGTVLAFGVKRLEDNSTIPLPELEVGKRVVFVKYLAEQHSNLHVRELFDGLIKVNYTDIMLLLDTDEDLAKLFH